MATGVSQGMRGTAAGDCRMCQIGRMVLRSVAFMAVGVALALLLSWVASRVPVLGVVLGVISALLLARTLFMLFVRPKPLVALAHLGASFALGIAVAFLVGLLVG